MSRRPLLPLLCLLAWAPLAQAFPPCPQAPVDLLDANENGATFSPDSPPWSRGWYQRYGAQEPGQTPLGDTTEDPDDISTGKCRDLVPLPQTMTPGGDPLGIVVLPDLRFIDGKFTAHYTLRFNVDTQPLAAVDDNVELARLEFETIELAGPEYPQSLTAVYRVRKRQTADGTPVLEVLESLLPVDPAIGTETRNDTVVATLPMPANASVTDIGLRWTQFPGDVIGEGGGLYTLSAPSAPSPSPGETPDGMAGTDTVITPQPLFARNVDSQLDVLDGTGQVIYRASLPSQWASTLSMGLLDRHFANASLYAEPYAIYLGAMSLEADAE